jgi:hypothetical protein
MCFFESARLQADGSRQLWYGREELMLESGGGFPFFFFDRSKDVIFMKKFLGTYKTFCSANDFFVKLQQRFEVPSYMGTKQQVIHMRIYNVLKQWIQNSFDDWDQVSHFSCSTFFSSC